MKLNILYSTDENYARHCAASLYSLLDNNKNFTKISIYIIENNLSQITKEKFLKIANKFKRELKFIEMNLLCGHFEKNNDFPISAYSRLFIEKIDDEIDKILYLDCDTIINNSLEELWNTNIENYLIAAVQDPIQSFNVQLIGLSKYNRYINSGVLLINLKMWRNINITQKIINVMNEYCGNIPHHDQGVLNIICNGKILYLHPKYNYMPEMICMNSKQLKKIYLMKEFYSDTELKEAKENPYIIHFITKWYNRPWYKSCTHPLKKKYIDYLNYTGFNTDLLDGQLKRRILFQKKLFENLPFIFYLIVQRLFDFRRMFIVKTHTEKRHR